MSCSVAVVVVGTGTKPSRFTHFWQGAQSLALAKQNDICTSKSAPYPSVFPTFDFKMCFAPQRRVLFRHLNFQKWSEAGVFCTFWLGNVFRTTTACVFSTSQLPKVVRTWCVLCILTSKRALRHNGVHFFGISTSKIRAWCAFYILTWKSASHHNGVQLFISHLARWLRTCGFSEPTFRPSGATNQSKDTVFRDSLLPFRAPGSSFFWLSLLWSSFFSSLLFSDSSRLCFSSVHIVGSLTSKLPSTRCITKTLTIVGLSNNYHTCI